MNGFGLRFGRAISRRAAVGGLLGAAALRALGQDGGAEHGRVSPPVEVPDFGLMLADGTKSSLRRMLAGRATAIQLMFTACRTTCPMEGAVFERVQTLMPDQVKRGLQLLSLSVSAGGEEPGALEQWMRRFHARAGWMAAVPEASDLPAMSKLFGQGRSVGDPHTTQVQMVDRKGLLIWRSSELPSSEEVAALLSKL